MNLFRLDRVKSNSNNTYGRDIKIQDKLAPSTAQKMKFPIKDFCSKFDQIRSFLQIWSHLVKKSLMENFIFYVAFNKASFPWKKTFHMTYRIRKSL